LFACDLSESCVVVWARVISCDWKELNVVSVWFACVLRHLWFRSFRSFVSRARSWSLYPFSFVSLFVSSSLLCACYFVLDLSLSSLDGCGSCGFGFGSELGFCQLVEFVLSVIK
jgi:hypothetical protein